MADRISRFFRVLSQLQNGRKIGLPQFAGQLVSGGPETYHALYFPFRRA
jgi:hypothetical protein